MSHLIKGVNLDAEELIQLPQKKIIKPQFKNIFKNIQLPTVTSSNYKEDISIANLCKNLTEKQFQNIHRKNAAIIQKKCSKLKKKLKTELPQNQRVIKKIFDSRGQDDDVSLKDLLKNMPQKIYLGKKYHFQLKKNNYLQREVSEIDQQKENYRKWLDASKNDHLSSPNFKRMNFLFQKLQNPLQSYRMKDFPEGMNIHKPKQYTGKYLRIKTNPI